MIVIVPPKKGEKYPLFFQRHGRLPLSAFLQLHMESRTVTFGYFEDNSEPAYVTLGHVLWRRIDARTSRRASTKIAQELQPLLERICDGYSVDWDGHNHRGALDDDAQSAAEQMTARLKETYDKQICGF